MDFLKRSWAEINLDALHHNICSVKKTLLPQTKLMGIVKADGYGHGACSIAQHMMEWGADWLGVSNLNEAISLRNGGISAPVLVLGATPAQCAANLAQYHITQTVFSPQYAEELEQEAAKAGVLVEVHIKVDTGMARLGFDAFAPQIAVEQVCTVFAQAHLHIGGIFTHFACADEVDASACAYTKEQYRRFVEVCRLVEQRGHLLPLKHCCNSGGVLNYPEMQMDMVRPGIILYGLYPTKECAGAMDLIPVMELYTTISMVKDVPQGACISYGRTFEAPHPMRIATVPIGYADGYPRSLSSKGQMLVAGKIATVVGRVCMDQLMLDVTNIPEAKEGGIVTIVGAAGGTRLSVEALAQASGTVNYEVVCLVGKRMPRIYRQSGRQIQVLDYVLQCGGIATELLSAPHSPSNL